MIPIQDITGIVLAGGQGCRMGGVDKGLQGFHGMPLALHALVRLRRQVGTVMLSANRNLSAYQAFGAPVWADRTAGYPGPLAGFMAGLEHCETPWLLTVPCDAPLFPPDLARRLASAALVQDAEVAVAAAPEEDGAGCVRMRPQPVFCLLKAELAQSLAAFMQADGRKIGAWIQQHRCAVVPFGQPGDHPGAFANVNTLSQLHALEADNVYP